MLVLACKPSRKEAEAEGSWTSLGYIVKPYLKKDKKSSINLILLSNKQHSHLVFLLNYYLVSLTLDHVLSLPVRRHGRCLSQLRDSAFMHLLRQRQNLLSVSSIVSPWAFVTNKLRATSSPRKYSRLTAEDSLPGPTTLGGHSRKAELASVQDVR